MKRTCERKKTDGITNIREKCKNVNLTACFTEQFCVIKMA